MNKRHLTIAAAALLGTGMSGFAYAQNADRGGDTSRAEVIERSAERFAKMDANNDGVVNMDDRQARAMARFDTMDGDGNGAVTRAEYAAHLEARNERREERRAERGGERGDRMGRRGRGGHRAMRGGRMMERADTDGDGVISQAELQAHALARFDAADANNDGTVTAAEKQAQRAERRQERRQQRGAN